MDKLIGIQVTDVTSIFGDNRFDIQAGYSQSDSSLNRSQDSLKQSVGGGNI